MPAYRDDPQHEGRRGEAVFAGFVLILALGASALSDANQERISAALQATALRPFIATQRGLAEARFRATQIEALTERVDSMVAVLSTHEALMGENRALRGALELRERSEMSFVPGTVLRPGTPGSESMFILDVGAQDGVRRNVPVVNPDGLVGVVREVRDGSAVGMDWTHPEFRASAMLEDGTAYGMVSVARGRFREDDRLVLDGVPFNQSVAVGTPIVTSGLGGVYPRGIPIGRIVEEAEAEGSWRRSYWVEPWVRPGSATHVVVLLGDTLQAGLAWPGDSTLVRDLLGEPPR